MRGTCVLIARCGFCRQPLVRREWRGNFAAMTGTDDLLIIRAKTLRERLNFDFMDLLEEPLALPGSAGVARPGVGKTGAGQWAAGSAAVTIREHKSLISAGEAVSVPGRWILGEGDCARAGVVSGGAGRRVGARGGARRRGKRSGSDGAARSASAAVA